jgi:hypothetical protein
VTATAVPPRVTATTAAVPSVAANLPATGTPARAATAPPGPTVPPQPNGPIPAGWKIYRGPVEFPIVFAYPPDWEVDDGLFPDQYALFLYAPNGRAENEEIEIDSAPRQTEANIDVLRDEFFYKKTEYCDKTGIERTSNRRIGDAQFAILGATCNAGTVLGFVQVASGLKGGDEWGVAMRVPYERNEAVVRDIFDPVLASINIYALIANR